MGLSSPLLQASSFCLWFRLYAHALLLESRVFPDIKLCVESLDYGSDGFADIWKGEYHGEPVCIKAIRTQVPVCLTEIERVCGYFIYQKRTHCQRASYKTLRREMDERESIPHPNVLPIIEVSETLVPFYIMSPWMPDGNIDQYIETNPGANRLTLVRAHQLETPTKIAS